MKNNGVGVQQTLFDLNTKTIEDIDNPATYKGIYSFHKYWGKKPTESIAFFIQRFTDESDVILDPFLGSGFIGRECLSQNRRFIDEYKINQYNKNKVLLYIDLTMLTSQLKP